MIQGQKSRQGPFWQNGSDVWRRTTRGLRERKGRRPAPNCGHILSLIPALGRRMRLYHSSSRRGYCGSLPGCVIPSLPPPPPLSRSPHRDSINVTRHSAVL